MAKRTKLDYETFSGEDTLPEDTFFVNIVNSNFYWHPKDGDMSTGTYVAKEGLDGVVAFAKTYGEGLLAYFGDPRLRLVSAQEAFNNPYIQRPETIN